MIGEDRDIGDGRQSQAMTVGEVLAEARHRRGLTVAEVSHYTSVRESIVRAIERDDYLLSGSEAHVRRDIHAIAIVLGLDSGPLISAFDAAYRPAPKPAAGRSIPPPIPFGRTGRDGAFSRIEPRRIRWVAALAVLVLGGLGFAIYHFVFAGAAHPSLSSGQAATSRPAAPSGSPLRALTPARVTAFGPHGAADGDNAALARLAADGNPATAWTTAGYGSPRFANAQPGTGLLLDMGKRVTITGAEITLGSVPGAGFQMRTGNTPSLADLSPVAIAADASGAMAVRLTGPVHARYVLIWFTALPQAGSSGAFQARVYNITIQGSSG
jgi:hypothetical protein